MQGSRVRALMVFVVLLGLVACRVSHSRHQLRRRRRHKSPSLPLIRSLLWPKDGTKFRYIQPGSRQGQM